MATKKTKTKPKKGKTKKPERVCFGVHLPPDEAKALRAFVKTTGMPTSTWLGLLVKHHLENPRPLILGVNVVGKLRLAYQHLRAIADDHGITSAELDALGAKLTEEPAPAPSPQPEPVAPQAGA